MARIYNWGMYPKIDAKLLTAQSPEEIVNFVRNEEVLIARGNGRCYGDSSLQNTILSTLELNKFLHFDLENGTIKCESGVLLEDILGVIVPKGFFLPVTPGTKFITIGGAVASNIHGKNHHKEGALSLYVQSFTLVSHDGELLNCSPDENVTLFKNTIGGMGLTGVIIDVTLKLKRIQTSYINQKSIKAKNLDEILALFESYNNFTYSVAWIDCLAKGKNLGRSILMLGEHSNKEDLSEQQKKNPLKVHTQKQITIPFTFPSFVLNKFSVKMFNTVYYHKMRGAEKDDVVNYDPFFYPLDSIKHWNRIYGKNGFTQYQFVLPFGDGKQGLQKILSKIAESDCASFLAVLKTFGENNINISPLSFPMPGYTLALDFKLNNKVLELLNMLDEMVVDYGGRLYLSKDVRMSKETFSKTYQEKFTNPEKFSSLQSQRLQI